LKRVPFRTFDTAAFAEFARRRRGSGVAVGHGEDDVRVVRAREREFHDLVERQGVVVDGLVPPVSR